MVTVISSKKAVRGFTLIELLVVVSIIALLVSILLPALSKARDSAKAVVCMTNQKAVGLATIYYMDDWNDALFPHWVNWEPEGYSRYWVGKLRKYLPDTDKTIATSTTSEYGISQVFICPGYAPFSADKATNWAQCYGWREWAMDNTTANDWNRFYQYRKMSVLSVPPSDFFLMADSMRNSKQYYALTVASVEGSSAYVHTRHALKANALFADGRVEPQSPSYFEQLSETQGDFHIRSVNRLFVYTGK